MADDVQAHLVVRGRVQRVNFRWTLKREADARGVRGWVRNRPDGAVEAVLKGPADAVGQVVDFARRGPPKAQVTSADVEWQDLDAQLVGFEIRD